MLGLHDQLLHPRLISFQVNKLCLQVIVLRSLQVDLVRQLLEISHNERINHLHVFIVLCRQVILHQSDLLTQKINFLLVLSHISLRVLDDLRDARNISLNIVSVSRCHTSG